MASNTCAYGGTVAAGDKRKRESPIPKGGEEAATAVDNKPQTNNVLSSSSHSVADVHAPYRAGLVQGLFDATTCERDIAEVLKRQRAYKCPPGATELQNTIPVFDLKAKDFCVNDGAAACGGANASAAATAEVTCANLYRAFFEGAGCVILRGVYDKEDMCAYNAWCEDLLSKPLNAANLTHPKQKDKYVINDVLERLSADNPELLLRLIDNPVFTGSLDALLGFMTWGAVTTHWIKPHGKRQQSHVDYPLHVGSGKFWEASVEKMCRMTTHYQREHILPYFSVQALIASDAMDKSNGSTEVVPHSHHVERLDEKVHDAGFYAAVEDKFINVQLRQGDVLLFNRRLCHRGGQNESDKRRNSLITQCVWLFGTGQHAIDVPRVVKNLEKSTRWQAMTAQRRSQVRQRLQRPYPINTTAHN